MIQRVSAIVMALALGFPSHAKPLPAQPSAVAETLSLAARDPAKAIRLVEPVIADSVIVSPLKDTRYFCADGLGQAFSGLVSGIEEGRSAVAYPADVCAALFIKGFSLIDLGRVAEAEPFLRRASELAPANAPYINEYAEWWKSQRQWQKSYDLFARAAALAPQQPTAVRDQCHARSLRGMGFNLIELGKLDEAEVLMTESLKLEPENQAAKSELAYVAKQRAKAAIY